MGQIEKNFNALPIKKKLLQLWAKHLPGFTVTELQRLTQAFHHCESEPRLKQDSEHAPSTLLAALVFVHRH